MSCREMASSVEMLQAKDAAHLMAQKIGEKPGLVCSGYLPRNVWLMMDVGMNVVDFQSSGHVMEAGRGLLASSNFWRVHDDVSHQLVQVTVSCTVIGETTPNVVAKYRASDVVTVVQIEIFRTKSG